MTRSDSIRPNRRKRTVWDRVVIASAIILFSFGWNLCLPFGEARAADKAPLDLDYPLWVINVASIQRLRDNAGLMFELAERLDMVDRVDQWMADDLKETKGFDRKRPFGTMFYLKPGSFVPMDVQYLPVTNLDEALETLVPENGIVVPVEGKPNRKNIEVGKDVKLRTLYQNGYLFFVGPNNTDASLDRDFPDPEKLVQRLSAQYDISASALIKTIPIGLKTVFLAALKTQTQAALQQRDDEPESAYRLRRAHWEGWLEVAERIVNLGNDLTLGLKLDSDHKSIRIDFDIAGDRDSKLAKFFQALTGKRTYFANLLPDSATLTTSLSLVLEEKQRKLFVKYFEVAKRDLIKKFDEGAQDDFEEIIGPIFKAFTTTADVGHLDAFVRLKGDQQGEFVLLGGVKVATSRDLPRKFEDLLEFLVAEDNEWVSDIEMNHDSIDSLPVHRLPIDSWANIDERWAKIGERMFGQDPSLYLYATPQALWFSFGAERALNSLKDAVQKVAQPANPAQDRNRVPLLVLMHANNWVSLANDEETKSDSAAKRAMDSFTDENDTMILEFRPTDSGLRIRVDFQAGFLAMMGRGISSGVDRGVFRRRPPSEENKEKNEKPLPTDLDDQ